jgi:hypothetical protein
MQLTYSMCINYGLLYLPSEINVLSSYNRLVYSRTSLFQMFLILICVLKNYFGLYLSYDMTRDKVKEL